MNRRLYIDWLRGIAVLVMIEWHALDAWTRPASREGDAFWVLAFIGGWAAPLFLFLAGVAVPLAGERRLARGHSRREVSRGLQRRGWQIFLLAHLFRLQSFLLNPAALWSSIIKPDILNILGLGMVAAAFCWGRVKTRRDLWIWLVATALAAAILAPIARGWWWPSLLYPRFEAYIRPVGTYGVFTLFPWVGVLLAGAVAGSAIARQPDSPAFHRRLASAGGALVLLGLASSLVPSPFAHSSFWTTSLSFFLIRCGAMTAALAGAWWLTRRLGDRWSPLVLFGRHSLFVYWVHVELAYGVFTKPLHRDLGLPAALGVYAILVLIMLGLTIAWQRWRRQPLVPPHLQVASAGS